MGSSQVYIPQKKCIDQRKEPKYSEFTLHWLLPRIYGLIKTSLLCSKINPDYLLLKQNKRIHILYRPICSNHIFMG